MRSLANRFALMAVITAIFAGPAGAATVNVQVISNQFVPRNITVNVGDTVQWDWGSGSHTVTSGTGSSDVESGVLFNAPSNAFSRTFSFTFTEAGLMPYYCIPHEFANMKGSVDVVAGGEGEGEGEPQPILSVDPSSLSFPSEAGVF